MRRIFIITVLFFTCSLWALIPPEQRQGLINFYNAMDGDSWINNSGWKTPEGDFSPHGTEEDWYGIELYTPDQNSELYIHRVDTISFLDNNLSGVLTDSLFVPFEDYLRYLVLGSNTPSNAITGALPDFSTYHFLYSIAIFGYPVTGQFSIDGSYRFPGWMAYLNLSNTQFSGPLTPLFYNTNAWVYLWGLDLSGCPLGGTLPETIALLGRLREIDLSRCGFSGPLPESIGSLNYLTHLFLNDNGFSGPIPGTWTQLDDLQLLHLRGNALSGEIPANIVNMESLLDNGGLNLHYNALNTIDSNVWDFVVQKHTLLNTPVGYVIDFRDTQTLPPAQFYASLDSEMQVNLYWTQAPNSWLPGYYRIWMSEDNSNWSLIHETLDKETLNHSVAFEGEGLHRWFRISTITTPHAANADSVFSNIRVARVTDAIWFDDFEIPYNWQLSGDFAIGEPQTGNVCLEARSPGKVLGTNLSGNYAANASDDSSYAITPPFNCSGKTNVKLHYWSFSQFEGVFADRGLVRISIAGGPWETIEVLRSSEDSWTPHWVDISAFADNQSDVRIMFSYYSDAVQESTGWNIDDIIVRSLVPMNGLYYVDPETELPGVYQTLNAAIEDLNMRGTSGSVIFALYPDTFFEEELYPIAVSGSPSQPIYFARSHDGAKPLIRSSGSASAADAILKLKGADYISFLNIAFEAIGTEVEYGILLEDSSGGDGAQYNVFENCDISGTAISGVYSRSLNVPLDAAGPNSYNGFNNININSHGSGIVFENNWLQSFAEIGYGNQIMGCTITGSIEASIQDAYGIRIDRYDGTTIKNNHISGISAVQNAFGVWHNAANSDISSNRINALDANAVTGISAKGSRIYNNMISLQNGAASLIQGIQLQNGYNSFVDFNSIRVEGAGSSVSTAVSCPTSSPLRLSNNILANFSPGQTEGRHSLIEAESSQWFASNGSLSDANLFFLSVPPGGGTVWLRNSAVLIPTLADWRDQSQRDQISKEGDPQFVSPQDLHIRMDVPTRVQNNGHWLQSQSMYSWVDRDIDYDIRHDYTPDIGADEGDFILATDPPFSAWPISPLDGAAYVRTDQSPILTWTMGMDDNHPLEWTMLYFSASLQDVVDLIPAALVQGDGTQIHESYSSDQPLISGQTYYWRVVTGNSSGSTLSEVFCFQTEATILAYPYAEGFDAFPFPPAGWRNLESTLSDGLSGNNLQQSWMGWNAAWDPQYIHSGDNAVLINSWMMPSYQWLESPLFLVSAEAELSFWLYFDHTVDNPTALHLMIKQAGAWQILRSWDSQADINLYSELVTIPLDAYAGEQVRFAFVYDVYAYGLPTAVDEFIVNGSAGMDSPLLHIEHQADGQLRLHWEPVAGAQTYRIYYSSIPLTASSSQWTLLVETALTEHTFQPADQHGFYIVKAARP